MRMTTMHNVGTEIESGDIFFVDPFVIEMRAGTCRQAAPTCDLIVEMAVSLHAHGQRRPVECSSSGDGRLLLLHGLTRLEAARLLCTGFRYADPKSGCEIKVKDRKFKIKVVIVSPPDCCGLKT